MVACVGILSTRVGIEEGGQPQQVVTSNGKIPSPKQRSIPMYLRERDQIVVVCWVAQIVRLVL